MTKVAINGFGRIGRAVFREIIRNYPDLEIVAINDLADNKTLLHLLKHDSIYGRYDGGIDCEMLSEKDPEKLPWKKLGADIVLECTGHFRKLEDAKKHIKAGAKKVILSAPAKSEGIPGFVLGVNEKELDLKKYDIIDMGSCTTNCLAPMAKVLNDNFKIKTGFMTTIHSYTNDQKLLDLPHKDLRRARAAALNIVPTTTGATKAIGKIIPELNGKLDGIALRVPTPTVSIVDLVVEVEKATTTDEVNKAFEKASKLKEFKGILKVEKEPLVSTDYIGNSYCATIDSALTDAHKTLIKVIGWYDNEHGYSSHLAQFANLVASKL